MGRVAKAVGLLAAVAATALSLRADDEVTYFDRSAKKEAKISGTIQNESVGQITIKSGAANQRIPSADVLDVLYEVSPGFRIEYRNAKARETAGEVAVTPETRSQELSDAVTRYDQLFKSTTPDAAKRHIEFRKARSLALRAADPGTTKEAIEALRRFQRAHSQSWQRWPASELLAELLLEGGDVDAAKQVYEDLASIGGLPREAAVECGVRVVRILLDAQRADEASKRLSELQGQMHSNARDALRVKLLAAECLARLAKPDEVIAQLETLVNEVADADGKALVYNALGDCQRLANRSREAMWSYLWVDVIYNANRHGQAKALYHLAKLFSEFKDEKRAQGFRDRLSAADFVGTEHHRKIVKGK